MMFDLRTPFWGNIFKGWRTDYREADEEDVSLRVGERPQSVVVLLAGRVPEAQRHRDSVTNHRGRVIVKPGHQQSEQSDGLRMHLHCWDIFSGETVCGVGYQHTSLPHRPVTHHHTLDRSPARHLGWIFRKEKMSTFIGYFSVYFEDKERGKLAGQAKAEQEFSKIFHYLSLLKI